jgi:hypothetical protein
VLADDGVLSLELANRDWLALRAARRGEHAAALRLVQTGGSGRRGPGNPEGVPRSIEHLGFPPGSGEAMTLAEVEVELAKAGFEVVAAAGVGVFADAGDDDLGQGELAALMELERLVAAREPYRSSARTLHLIGRRRILRPDLTGYTA